MRVKTAQPVPSLDIIAIIFIIKNYDNYMHYYEYYMTETKFTTYLVITCSNLRRYDQITLHLTLNMTESVP